ncbi:SDR family oxidoreductase [Actinospongicola halichondriae]|uniref:SDR family oxidoreductase n=1 Tax=Actinospongicola halichondriae TaxID=3236844 RepID=UPI003D4F7DDE
MGLLEGRVALVAGVGPGLGREIALAYAREGADVVLCARKTEQSEEVASMVRDLGRRAEVAAVDVTDRAACDAAVAVAVERLGGLHILVNNAFHGGDFAKFEDAELRRWSRTMDVNFFGALTMTQAALPALKEAGDGRVVMINTMSSTNNIEKAYGAYAASKGALATATRTLAMELGEHGIRVNAVHPGYIWGPNVEIYFDMQAAERGVTSREIYDEVAAKTALGYLAPAAEIAGAAVFFASDLARPITGQAIGVDAGQWI